MAIKLTSEQVFPPVGSAILVSTRPNAIFGEDGKPTGRTDGIRLDVRSLPDLTPVSVKIPGAQAPMSNDELERLALSGQLTWVEFTGFSGTQWLDRKSGDLRVSGTATGVKLVSAPVDDDIPLDID